MKYSIYIIVVPGMNKIACKRGCSGNAVETEAVSCLPFPFLLRCTHASVVISVYTVHVQCSYSRADSRAYVPKLWIAWYYSCAERQVIEAGGP